MRGRAGRRTCQYEHPDRHPRDLLPATAATDRLDPGRAPGSRLPPRARLALKSERSGCAGRATRAVRGTSVHGTSRDRGTGEPRTLNRLCRSRCGADSTLRCQWLGAPDELDPVRENVGTVRGTTNMERLDTLVAATSRGRTIHTLW